MNQGNSNNIATLMHLAVRSLRHSHKHYCLAINLSRRAARNRRNSIIRSCL